MGKVCHHDLSLENILLDDKGSAIIIDFGMACKLPDDEGKVGFSFQDSTKEKESICSLRSLSNEKRDDILLDNVSIVTDKTAFFDFEEDFVQRRQKRNRSFYNQLSDFFLCKINQKRKSALLFYLNQQKARNLVNTFQQP